MESNHILVACSIIIRARKSLHYKHDSVKRQFQSFKHLKFNQVSEHQLILIAWQRSRIRLPMIKFAQNDEITKKIVSCMNVLEKSCSLNETSLNDGCDSEYDTAWDCFGEWDTCTTLIWTCSAYFMSILLLEDTLTIPPAVPAFLIGHTLSMWIILDGNRINPPDDSCC